MANVLVGISSSVSIYKMCDVVRELKLSGHEVRVIMTPFAERFVSSLTFHSLTGYKPYKDWEDDPLLHISLSRWADVFMIAPCSVNTLSKIALGIADNLLTTTVLAYPRNLLIAPAANTNMYKNPTLQKHLDNLKNLGHIIIDPEEGLLACEERGQGKLASKERLIDWVEYSLRKKPLNGKKVLITCGSTREFLDSVRFISNYSTGEMGFSLARVFRWYGAEVRIVAGFTSTPEPPEIEIIKVTSAEDMHRKVKENLPWADIIVMNAAVADYKPMQTYQGKMKKTDILSIQLVKNIDILESIGQAKGEKLLIGFALEEEDQMLQFGKEKLRRKNLDAVIVNPIQVMGSKSFRGFILTKSGQVFQIAHQNKLKAAEDILNTLLSMLTH